MISGIDLGRFESFSTSNELVGTVGVPAAIPLIEIAQRAPDPTQTLLGNRWLCRGGAALIVGSSGIGKSSLSLQQDICWALGEEAFGIKPVGPLKILTIQAENDEGDLYEIATGVLRGLNLSNTETALRLGDNVRYVCERSRVGWAFVSEVVRPLVREHRPDIIRIDPLQAFAGADLTQAAAAAQFLRNELNPLLSEFGCGLVLVHHTPKSNGSDKKHYRTADWMYSGAGSHDIVNWARAVLIIDASKTEGLYRFIAAKRGRRIGWEKDGEKQIEKWFQWGRDGIYWEEAASPQTGANNRNSAETLLAQVPHHDEIEKGQLFLAANRAGVSQNKLRPYLNGLIKDGHLVEEKVKAKGRKPMLFIRRSSIPPSNGTSAPIKAAELMRTTEDPR